MRVGWAIAVVEGVAWNWFLTFLAGYFYGAACDSSVAQAAGALGLNILASTIGFAIAARMHSPFGWPYLLTVAGLLWLLGTYNVLAGKVTWMGWAVSLPAIGLSLLLGRFLAGLIPKKSDES